MQRLESSLDGHPKARLGVAMLDTGSGLSLGWRQDERFPMASTFKLLLAAWMLERVDRGQEALDRRVHFDASALVAYSPVTEKRVGDAGITVGELCEGTVTLSDNTAANLLLARHGGPQGFTAFVRGLGDTVTRLDRTEPTLNEAIAGDPRDTTTPQAMLQSLRKVALGDALSPASRAQAWSNGSWPTRPATSGCGPACRAGGWATRRARAPRVRPTTSACCGRLAAARPSWSPAT